MGKRKRSASSCKSRSQRRPSPRLSASRGPPFTALSRQGGYAHILKGYFYTNLVGTLTWRLFAPWISPELEIPASAVVWRLLFLGRITRPQQSSEWRRFSAPSN